MVYVSIAWAYSSSKHAIEYNNTKSRLQVVMYAPWLVRNSQLHRECNLEPVREYKILGNRLTRASRHHNILGRHLIMTIAGIPSGSWSKDFLNQAGGRYD
ncbi:hypothetical protein Zmor_012249 [Zophobas morio]|uniref:Uncharacterized protein n=1 Tax=Zophobas morio TaxID=2755281 RepID=A0AA38LZD3_9CUCU|nr:hypothetical protein Zmor_012249 [Zophobas morio]